MRRGWSGRRDWWLVLAVTVVAALAGLDLAVHSAILTTALVAPPLIAAAGCGPRSTATVAGLSFGVALALGVPDGVFGTQDHLIRCTIVAGGGLLGVLIAGFGQRLTSSRDQLRAILEGVADAVVARDADGRTVFANPAAIELLGFDSEAEMRQWPGEPVTAKLEVTHEDGRPLAPDELPGRRAARGDSPPPATVRLRSRVTGQERWAVVKATSLPEKDGRSQMAIVIVEDVTEVKRHERRQRLLAQAGAVLASSLDPDPTLRSIAELLVPDLADWCVVDVAGEPGTVREAAVATADPTRLDALRRLRERWPPDASRSVGLAHVLRTGEPIFRQEVSPAVLEEMARDREHLRALSELGVRSAMVVPMLGHGVTVGAMTLVTAESGRRFDQDDLSLARELGERMGTALETARLYEERSHIARALQESLLPPTLPDIGGVDVAARFRAAGAGHEVGGDFYDVFESGASRWAVVVGDVCGKGAHAAAVTALARYTLRTAAMRESRPSQVLGTLNEAIVRQRHPEQFCTVAMAVLEPSDGGAHVTVSVGGHPLPLLLRADGTVARLGQRGTLLGIVDDPQLSDASDGLVPGDVLVFYTDGLTDAQAPERILSATELATALSTCSGLDAATVAERLEARALPDDREPRDDVAILVLRLRVRSDLAAGATSELSA